MEFANLLLLFGGLAFAVPLLIHLLNRSRFDVVPWAAMHLLQTIPLQNQRRWKWRSWLLLLIRCLIPVLLAVCMARPLLTAWKTGSGGSTSLTIVLDNTYSMQAPLASQPGRRGVDWARQQVADLIDRLGNDTQYSILLADRSPDALLPGSTYDQRKVKDHLARWKADQTGLAVPSVLTAARNLSANSPLSNRQIVVISDFQESDWMSSALASQEEPESDRYQWTLLPVATLGDGNLQVRWDHRYSEVLGIQEATQVRATIENHDSKPHQQVPVQFRVDDQPVANRTVDLEPGGQAQVVFRCQFRKPGSHSLVVDIQDSGWSVDNQDQLTVQVLEPLNVLLVEPEGESSQSAFYWELAILAADNPDTERSLRTRRLSLNQLEPATIRQADLLVLFGIPQLPSAIQQQLAEQIAQGTGLLVICGHAIQPATYNQWTRNGQSVLPATVGAWESWNPSNASDSDADTVGQNPDIPKRSLTGQIAPGPYPHPALAFFDSALQGDLTGIRVFQHAPLTPAPESNVALTAGDGEPLLVTRPLEQGQVAILGFDSQESSSNLALDPTFVPLVRRLALSLSGKANEQPRPIVSDNESVPNYLDQAEMDRLARHLGAEVVGDAESCHRLLATRRNGWEIWRYVLAGLVVFLFVELLVQRPFTGDPA